MATAMLTDRGLRRKVAQEEPKRGNKRKPPAPRPRPEPNNNVKRPRIDCKSDMLGTYQPWVIQTYGDLAKTKTITIKKYARILRTLRGEEVVSADNSKFRFWVKAKGFHVGKPPGYDAKPADAIVGRYSVCDTDIGIPSLGDKLVGSSKDPPLYVPNAPFKNSNCEPVYRKVAVVENFFDIIYNVHVELEGRPGKHAGQKRTYRTITETYAFLPREAVTRFLLGCTECQRRPRSPSPASVLPTPSPSPTPTPAVPLPPAAAPRAPPDLGGGATSAASPGPGFEGLREPARPLEYCNGLPPKTADKAYLIRGSDVPAGYCGVERQRHLRSLGMVHAQTELDRPLSTSTPESRRSNHTISEPRRSGHTSSSETRRSNITSPEPRRSHPLDVCNLTSRDPPKAATPPKLSPAKSPSPPKKRHLNHLADYTDTSNARLQPAPKLWSPALGLDANKNRGFPEGEIDFSLPITTTYLKYMRSLGCTDEDALKLENVSVDFLYSRVCRDAVPGWCVDRSGQSSSHWQPWL